MTDQHRSEKIFHRLRRSRAAETDFEALWLRIEARLEPPSLGVVSRFLQGLSVASRHSGLRLAGAVTAITGVVIVVSWQPSGVDEITPEVAMLGPIADALTSEWELDVRLVRGFKGAPPADVRGEVVDGAGGASRLADLRSDLASLVSFDDFGLVGEWYGQLHMEGDVPLSASRTLAFEVVGVNTNNHALQLRNVWLEGEERVKVASEMTLTPGDPYLIGLRPTGELETSRLFLAIVVRSGPIPVAGSADWPQK